MYDAIVSTHSRLKAAGTASCDTGQPEPVSTHSRLKAAGQCYIAVRLTHCRFNTQPPKGGWHLLVVFDWRYSGFNTQPPEGGWLRCVLGALRVAVSTHSRLKAAGASLKSLAPSGFAALISLSSQEKREREYNTAFSVTPEFAIS